MNESMSIFLATTILALGGIGLYMFKTEDDKQSDENEEYNEEGLFGSNNDTFGLQSFFNWGSTENEAEVEVDNEENIDPVEEEEYKPRKRAARTQKNRKPTGSSRRRY
jgi:hypothetical protein